jgi:hypothetical protein
VHASHLNPWHNNMSSTPFNALWNAQSLAWINQSRIRDSIDARKLRVRGPRSESDPVKVISVADHVDRTAGGRCSSGSWDGGNTGRESSNRRRQSSSNRGDSGSRGRWGRRRECELSLADRSGRHIRPWDIGNGQFLIGKNDVRPPQTICLYDCRR